MMNTGLRFRNVGKTFHSKDKVTHALKSVSFDAPAGRLTAIVGPSGCGKSTLLNIAAGLDTVYEGRIDRPPGTTHGFLFQTPRLLPWLTAEKNVTFILETVHGKTPQDAKNIARHHLRLVGLEGFESHFPGELSGGMQQRVALVRALVVEPQLMFMDEPFAALDELTARQMREEVRRLLPDGSCTVMLVTHNVTEAAYMADHIVVMGGRPGTVKAVIDVDVPHPRDYDSPQIAAIARRVVDHLFDRAAG